jgi:hypothetical protein
MKNVGFFWMVLGLSVLVHTAAGAPREKVLYMLDGDPQPDSNGYVHNFAHPATGHYAPNVRNTLFGRWQTDGEGALVFKVKGFAPGHDELSLLFVEYPEIAARRYAFTGEMKYEKVAAFDKFILETVLFTDKPHDGIIVEAGVPIHSREEPDDSDWRPFSVSYRCFPWQKVPQAVHLGVRLTEPGRLYLRNVKVVEYPDESAVWWSDRTAGWIGSIGGVALGLIGVFLGFLGCRGTLPAWTEYILATLTIGGGLSLVGGGVALAWHQPYGVWYPLALFGVIMSGVFGANWNIFRRKRHEIELRRMASLDVDAPGN